MRAELETKMERTEMRMIRWMCGVSLKERQPSTELGVEAVGDVMRRGRLRWHRLVERKDDADYVKAYTRLVVEGKASVGRPRKTWQDTLSADMRLLKVDTWYIHDQTEMEDHRTSKDESGSVWNNTLKRRRRIKYYTLPISLILKQLICCTLHTSSLVTVCCTLQ